VINPVENAEFFEKAGTAIVLWPGGTVEPKDLAVLVRRLADQPEELTALAVARIEQTDGAAVIAGAIEAALAGASGSPVIPAVNPQEDCGNGEYNGIVQKHATIRKITQ
jgi:hypothetical protein